MTSPCSHEPSVLLVSDMAGYGKVALSVMIPVLSHFELNVSSLPTALVSNTLDYGRFDILETTDFMKNTLQVWADLGFSFDAVFVGFLFSAEQSELITDYCTHARKDGTPVFFDPIMGDWGKLYNGVTEDDVIYRRSMCSVADVIMPNMTEAQYLCGEQVGKESLSTKEADRLVKGLRSLGCNNVVITSFCLDDRHCTLVAEHGAQDYDLIYYDELPLQMPGTGDIFSSVLLGAYMRGISLSSCVRLAMRVVALLLQRCLDDPDCLRGIPVEVHLKDVMAKAVQEGAISHD